jgi:hypothetical protein
MNKIVPQRIRPRAAFAVNSSPVNPVIYERYAGTSGKTHGERNATIPAIIAIGNDTNTDPFKTFSVNEDAMTVI